jgi:hypothetical protein
VLIIVQLLLLEAFEGSTLPPAEEAQALKVNAAM